MNLIDNHYQYYYYLVISVANLSVVVNEYVRSLALKVRYAKERSSPNLIVH
jgi:hypothetical protein